MRIPVEDVYQFMWHSQWKSEDMVFRNVAALYDKDKLGFFGKRAVRRHISRLEEMGFVERTTDAANMDYSVFERPEILYRRKIEAPPRLPASDSRAGGLEQSMSPLFGLISRSSF